MPSRNRLAALFVCRIHILLILTPPQTLLIVDSINRLYSLTFESSSISSVDSAYILSNGSVPLDLTITHDSLSIQIFAPSRVSTFLKLPCVTHAFTTLSALLLSHLNFV